MCLLSFILLQKRKSSYPEKKFLMNFYCAFLGISPTSNGALVNRILNKESLVNQSHDSGVDSMNTNSSGSMMSSRSPIIDSEKFARQITLV